MAKSHVRVFPSSPSYRLPIIGLTISALITLITGQQQGQVSFGLRKLAYSTNQFGLDLMRSFDRSDSQLAFCPMCISNNLAMLLAGAHGSASSSLRHALYLWGMSTNDINMAYYDMCTHLGVNLPPTTSGHGGHGHYNQLPNSVYSRRSGVFGSSAQHSSAPSLSANGTGNEVIFLNNVYVQRDYPINYHYHLLLQRFYKTAVHPVDFYYNGEETRSHINAYFEKSTAGKLDNILAGRQNPSTQLLLLSGLYFKGTLDMDLIASRGLSGNGGNVQPPLPMRPAIMSSPVFGEELPVWLESQSARIRYGFSRYLNATTIEMPFKGGLITLVLMMPGEASGLETMLTKLSAQILTDTVNSLEVKRVHVKMPRLSFEKGSGNLSWALTNMGLADLFKPGYAQLYDVSDYKWLSVSDIIHKTYLDIKEPNTFINNVPQPAPQQPIKNVQQKDQHVSLNTAPKPVQHLFYNQQNTNPFSQHSNMNANNPYHGNQYQTQSVVPPQQVIPPPSIGGHHGTNSDTIEVIFDKPFVYFVIDNISGLVLVMGKVGREPATYRLPIH